MALKLKGLDATLTTFREVDRRFNQTVAAELEAGAKAIAALARMFAPIDRGDLVKSIRAQRVTGDVNSTKWRVKVGGTIGGRDVSAYALAAHEGFSTNRKSWKLGKKSRDKARALGVRVGVGYLSRAFKQLAPSIKKKMRAALNDQVTELGRRSNSRKNK